MSRKARERRIAAAAAAKERRTKILAFGGVIVLAGLLFIQGPRMLDLVGGGGGETEAAPPPPVTQTTEVSPRAPIAALGAAVDPFAARRLVDAEPRARNVAAPAGTRDPFRAVVVASASPASPPPPSTPKPPAQAPASPLPNQIVIGKPGAGGTARRGWIVVLASIPTASGKGVADGFAARARREGLTSVGVLESSTQRPLRSGYFVVYNGPYETLAAVQRAADHVHAFGYRTAYVREILRY